MKKTVITILILIVCLFVGYKYLYHEHRDVKSEQATVSKTVTSIFDEFKADESKANSMYLEKKVSVSGKVTNIDSEANTIVLEGKLSAKILDKIEVKVDDNVVVEGRLIGFNSLLDEINLDQALIK